MNSWYIDYVGVEHRLRATEVHEEVVVSEVDIEILWFVHKPPGWYQLRFSRLEIKEGRSLTYIKV